jgi:uncharacterized protein (TIGR02453 family)
MKQHIIEFLIKLNQNNNREWFLDHKREYDEARKEFLLLVDQLIVMLLKTNPSYAQLKASDAVFRINRDLRFSQDKSPYKTHFGAYMASGGRKSPLGGHYLHVEPGNCFLAGGVYCPTSENLKVMRSEIYFNFAGFEEIVKSKEFVSLFGEVKGDKLKKPPVGFPKNFIGIDYLKFKDYTLMHHISDEEFYAPDFLEKAVVVFEAMNPFNQFLNQGMANKPDAL